MSPERRRADLGALAGRRMPLGGVLVVGATIAIAIACANGITALRSHADNSRQAETIVARVEAQTNLQTVHAWQAIGEREIASERARQIGRIRGEIQERLDELTWLAGDSDGLARLDAAVTRYQQALDAELAALASGDVDAARGSARGNVDAAFAELTALLMELTAKYSSSARQTNQLAELGTVSSLVSAAVLLSLLFRKVERARRTTALAAAEEKALRQSEERFRSLVQNSSDTITVMDNAGTILYQSASIERLLGYQPGSLVGTPFRALLHPDDDDGLRWLAVRHNEGLSGRKLGWRLRRSDGTWLDAESIATDLSSDENVRGIVLNTRDVTERKALEDQLTHRAYHDALTELPNRALFRDRLTNALARAERSDRCVGLLYLDLDDFKSVNDSLGHAAGDELLTGVAQRLRHAVRAGDTAARLAGDEFAILVEGGDEREVEVVAARVTEELAAGIAIGERRISVRASIGIAVSRHGDRTADGILAEADLAMYVAKARGKGRYEVFHPGAHQAALLRMELESELRGAIERDEFTVFFQPIVDLGSGRPVALEALVRWRHPTRGLLTPDAFLAVAEDAGLLGEIGRRVLAQACTRVASWRSRLPAARQLAVTVNLSPAELQAAGLVSEVRGQLAAARLPPDALIVEITERAVVADAETGSGRLAELKNDGVRIAVDDFGTGYSSLSYLRHLPLDILKIDKSFIAQLADGGSDAAVVRTIIGLGAELGLLLVAEGIEHPEQLGQLRALGCHLGQGYLLAKPLPAEEAEAFLADADGVSRPVKARRGHAAAHAPRLRVSSGFD